jgi:hypothetical protein
MEGVVDEPIILVHYHLAVDRGQRSSMKLDVLCDFFRKWNYIPASLYVYVEKMICI